MPDLSDLLVRYEPLGKAPTQSVSTGRIATFDS